MNGVLVKILGKLPPQTSLDPIADELYDQLGRHRVGIVEYVVADRTEPDPESDAHPVVRLRARLIEFALNVEDEAQVRTLMERLYRDRTSAGTLDLGAADVEPTGEVVRKPTDLSSVKPSGAARARAPRGRGGRG
jgi:hypothetical protein